MKVGLFIAGLVLLLSFTLYEQEGIASYYANKFQGKRTASGERYHKDSLTAAHKTLPFGTFIKVTNLKNDSTVILKVNDRIGTYKRIIDVSYAGAAQLNFIRQGITKVKIETIVAETDIDIDTIQ
jgi:rare lipoprotein A